MSLTSEKLSFYRYFYSGYSKWKRYICKYYEKNLIFRANYYEKWLLTEYSNQSQVETCSFSFKKILVVNNLSKGQKSFRTLTSTKNLELTCNM